MSVPSCEDGVRNGNEEGVDCGGPNCAECSAADHAKMSLVVIGVGGVAGVVVLAVAGLYLWRWYRLRQAVVMPMKPVPGPHARRVSLVNPRKVVLGKQHSWRASSTVTPIVNIEWSRHESRQRSPT